MRYKSSIKTWRVQSQAKVLGRFTGKYAVNLNINALLTIHNNKENHFNVKYYEMHIIEVKINITEISLHTRIQFFPILLQCNMT